MLFRSRSLLVIISTMIALSNAKSSEPFSGTVTAPEDAGAVHTEAFQRLADAHVARRPVNREELYRNAVVVLASYCEENDADCVLSVAETAWKEFRTAERGVERAITLPSDEKVLSSALERARDAVESLDDDNNKNMHRTTIDEVVSELESIRRDVSTSKDVRDENLRTAVLSGLSVVVESSKLWNEVYNDPDHVLYGMHDPRTYYDHDEEGDGVSRRQRLRRRLDQGSLDVSSIILSDGMGCLQAGIDMLSSDIGAITTNPQSIVTACATAGFSASVSELFSMGGNGYYGDDDGEYEENLTETYYGGGFDPTIVCSFAPVPMICP